MTPASDTTHKALSRRIKQHVIGRPQDFYTITLPGLETLCRGELAALEDPPADLRVSKGGVAFQGRLTSCYQANLMSRTASRVLMRIQQCKARHFDELEERVRAVPWELYLKIDVSLEVRASIRRSKLYHSQAVSERILKAVSARLALHGRKDAGTEGEGPVQCIWVRLQEDPVRILRAIKFSARLGLEISPATSTMPVVTRVSQATFEFGSKARKLSSRLSEI